MHVQAHLVRLKTKWERWKANEVAACGWTPLEALLGDAECHACSRARSPTISTICEAPRIAELG